MQPEPLWEKFVGWSVYQYGMNNPLRLVDDNGWFSLSGHFQMTYKAARSVGYEVIESTLLAINSAAYDIATAGGLAGGMHFDNLPNFESIRQVFSKIHTIVQKYKRDGAFGAFGRLLHGIQDFYAHSNYVELWIEYAQRYQIPVGDIPYWDEVWEEGKYQAFRSLLKQRLLTGQYPDRPEDSWIDHSELNKDEAREEDPGYRLRYKLAKKAAYRHTVWILEGLRGGRSDATWEGQ